MSWLIPFAFALAVGAQSQNQTFSGGGFLTAQQLKERCDSNEPEARAICLGYIMGVTDDFSDELNMRGPSASSNLCVPAALTNVELRDVVVVYLRRPDVNLNFPASQLVISAIATMFRCR